MLPTLFFSRLYETLVAPVSFTLGLFFSVPMSLPVLKKIYHLFIFILYNLGSRRHPAPIAANREAAPSAAAGCVQDWRHRDGARRTSRDWHSEARFVVTDHLVPIYVFDFAY